MKEVVGMADSTERKESLDPSANVIQLVGNAVKYLEDLHNASERSLNERFGLLKQIADSETERINALRAVDVAAVATANERAVKQAEVLAAQMAANAETLRASVAKTADTIAIQLQQLTTQQNERIAALEKVQYENQGKSGASSTLLNRVAELENSKSEIKGANAGAAMTATQFRNALITFGAILTILGLIFTYFYKG